MHLFYIRRGSRLVSFPNAKREHWASRVIFTLHSCIFHLLTRAFSDSVLWQCIVEKFLTMSFTLLFYQGKNVFLFINIVLWLNIAAQCYVFIWVCVCAYVCKAELCSQATTPTPLHLRSYLHLKVVDSRLSRSRNVKVRKSGAQMCVCGLRVCKRSTCVCTFASELNDPMISFFLVFRERRTNSQRGTI